MRAFNFLKVHHNEIRMKYEYQSYSLAAVVRPLYVGAPATARSTGVLVPPLLPVFTKRGRVKGAKIF